MSLEQRRATCCFTGHRDLPLWEEEKVRTRLRYRLMPMIFDRVAYFAVGGGLGFDLLAAEYLLKVRDEFKKQIRIISVLPYPAYYAGWPEEDIRRQEEIIRRSDKVVCACTEERSDAWRIRNKMMLDGSAHCVCYCRRLTGKTADAVRYAMRQGVILHNTSSWDIRQMRHGTAEKRFP